ncbi:MAG TPA: DUF2442 domain-containing protein [Thermoanaerobaculia bacterium]|nr:DUF2442 domain-containing protein [Thermoanaerobaculia bacterium]
MEHPIHRVVRFELVGPFTLDVHFGDGTTQRIDFEPVLRGELYGPLSSPAFFARVALDPEAGTLVWPNDADFDPAILHDWPTRGAALAALASRWSPPVRAERPAG